MQRAPRIFIIVDFSKSQKFVLLLTRTVNTRLIAYFLKLYLPSLQLFYEIGLKSDQLINHFNFQSPIFKIYYNQFYFSFCYQRNINWKLKLKTQVLIKYYYLLLFLIVTNYLYIIANYESFVIHCSLHPPYYNYTSVPSTGPYCYLRIIFHKRKISHIPNLPVNVIVISTFQFQS